ncbi:TIGR04282 family arsenosugar biosynthesis glycosyltransferase [Flavobacterium sp. ASW18X]|uniref:TIGR04282 family arsenosugar biosynthesis glycosyltransferase n=1 Tax=Flavobacterium sp. ASW18X TaxID=2572595 RepID=UPI0010ADB8B9|nr:TIGR04282 family arsenosugar biosynthesis glycosyltransferase [Flavobacterium sp. ASW18X]TKD60982.1 glycosyltransferase [Flavobacterium sp. ASW18X]
MQKNLLLIFTRNPELGKCKTRLAATVGDQAALDIYNFLLQHTAKVTSQLSCDKAVYYSEEIWQNDVWDANTYEKKLQEGSDLGEKMINAFKEGFAAGYKNIIVIGSDLYDIQPKDLNHAFEQLGEHDFVVGPAEDGGYYLLGMNKLLPSLFSNKEWGTDSVLQNTLQDLQKETYFLLEEKNDVDYFEDVKDIPAFDPFIKHVK